MFQFTNTIVLNSLKDVTTGLDKLVAREVDGKPALDIRRVNLFKQANVKAIYRRAASDPVLGSATFTLPENLGKGFYRVKLYIRLSGSENSYYANDFAFKGKPLYYEFKLTKSTPKADVAKEIVRVINKLQSFYGEKWVNARTTGAESDMVEIKAVDEFQRFVEAKIERLNELVCDGTCHYGCPVPYSPEPYEEIEDEGYKVDLILGKEGFGTYIHLLKDLRLPTMEHFRFAAHNSEELPIPGMKYNQYTLYYRVERGLFGGAAVGQQVTSMTTHVFYVLDAIDKEFKAAMVALVAGSSPTVAVTEVDKPLTVTDVKVATSPMANSSGTATLTPTVSPGSTADHTTAQSDADWIKVTPGTNNVTIKADNNSGAARSADVTVIAKKAKTNSTSEVTAAKKVTVSQNAG